MAREQTTRGILSRLFGTSRKARTSRLALERLEDRLAPAVVNDLRDLAFGTDENGNIDADPATPGQQISLRAALQAGGSVTFADTLPKNADGTISFVIDGNIGNLQAFAGTRLDARLADGTPGVEVQLVDRTFVVFGDASVQGLIVHGAPRNATGQQNLLVSIRGNGATFSDNYVGLSRDGLSVKGRARVLVSTDAFSTNAIIANNVIANNNELAGTINQFVAIDLDGSDHTLTGNRVGTTPDGLAAVSSIKGGTGVDSFGVTFGSLTGATNVVGGFEVGVSMGSFANLFNTFVGLGVDGKTAVPNEGGVLVRSSARIEGNVVSGNEDAGILVRFNDGNTTSIATIVGNKIGTDAEGKTAVGNLTGISNANFVTDRNDLVEIGTDANDPVNGNIIAGNTGVGIFATDATTFFIQGNKIGLGVPDGNAPTPLPNGSHGIHAFQVFNPENVIGGTEAGQGNEVAFNKGDGVRLESTVQDHIDLRLLGNQIHDNDGLGIERRRRQFVFVPPDQFNTIDDAGPTLAGLPELSGAIVVDGTLTVAGELKVPSLTGTTFRIEFFGSATADPTGFGEGAQFLGAIERDEFQDFFFEFQADVGGKSNVNFVTATVTRLGGRLNTSEFSFAVEVNQATSDLQVKNALRPVDQFRGNDVIEERASNAQKALNVATNFGETLVYDVRVQNDGVASGSFVVSDFFTDHDDENFLYEYTFNGTDVTSQVRSINGFTTPEIQPDGFVTIQVEITPKQVAPLGARTEVRLSTLVGDATNVTAQDQVAIVAINGLVVNTEQDLDDANLFDDFVLDVDPAQAGEQVSLRSAIRFANAEPGKQTITFDAGIGTIRVNSAGLGALPQLTDSETFIDGETLANVRIDGTAAGDDDSGLVLKGNRSRVRGLLVQNFGKHGILVDGADSAIVEENEVRNNGDDGIRVNGTASDPANLTRILKNQLFGNVGDGITVLNASNAEIRDNDVGIDLLGVNVEGNNENGIVVSFSSDSVVAENRIGDNGGHGILVQGNTATNTTIVENTIGVDALDADRGNAGSGIAVEQSAKDTTIGGDDFEARNTIAGNDRFGVEILTGSGGTKLFNNEIGLLDFEDGTPVGNDLGGVLVQDSADNVIGSADKGNVVQGNGTVRLVDGQQVAEGDGVRIEGAASKNNKVQGNTIGTLVDGEVGNAGNGVVVANAASDNTIGGANQGEGNVISGNALNGVSIVLGATRNKVLGNVIGGNLPGLGNREHGVFILDARANEIGGSTLDAGTGAGNVIANNGLNGVTIAQLVASNDTPADPGNTIQGNLIGLLLDGVQPGSNGRRRPAEGAALENRGPQFAGVAVFNSNGNIIGGGTDFSSIDRRPSGEGNVVSGNDGQGVLIVRASGTIVQGNIVGLNPDANVAVPNTVSGVLVTRSAQDTVIGSDVRDGDVFSVGNIISGNRASGIEVSEGASGTQINGNFLGGSPVGQVADFASLGNGVGVSVIGDVQDTHVGDGSEGVSRNVIRDNRNFGVFLFGVKKDAQVAGPFTVFVQNNDIRATIEDGNRLQPVGVHVAESQNVLIGPAPDQFVLGDAVNERNVIAGNEKVGIELVPIGGTTVPIQDVAIVGNEIGGNGQGLFLQGENTQRILVLGNRIVGNDEEGVLLEDASLNTLEENTITGNLVGLKLTRTTDDPVSNKGRFNGFLSNKFFDNFGIGIDLVGGVENAAGVTENDDTARDADFGANDLQNTIRSVPPLTGGEPEAALSAFRSGGRLRVGGTFFSTPGVNFLVQVFRVTDTIEDDNGGEGGVFLGEVRVTTNGDGLGEAIVDVPNGSLTNGDRITATVSRIRVQDGKETFETSELSQAALVELKDTDNDGTDDAIEDANPDAIPETNGLPPSEVPNVTSTVIDEQASADFSQAQFAALVSPPGAQNVRFFINKRSFDLDPATFEAIVADYKVTGLTPGAAHTFTLRVQDNALVGTIAFKVDANGNLGRAFSGEDVTIAFDPLTGESVATITIVDGGPFDEDGEINGEIDDPIAFVVAPPAQDDVTGQVFNDLNLDGRFSPGDRLLSGRTVFLDGDDDGVLDAGEPSALTGTDGRFVLNGQGDLSVVLSAFEDAAFIGTDVAIRTGAAEAFLPPAPDVALSGDALSALVQAMYVDLLGRAPSAQEVANLLPNLAQISMGRLVDHFLLSREFLSNQVREYYRDLLGREGSDEEVAGWVDARLAGLSARDVIVEFLTSAEFASQHQGNGDFVDAVYRLLLGRDAEASALTDLTTRLDAGLSRAEVVRGILSSQELAERSVVSLFAGLLRREPDAAGLEALAALSQATSLDEVVRAVLASQEYQGIVADRVG